MPLLGSRGAASTTGFGALANLGYFLRNSLRFRSSVSGYLNRTFSTPTNALKWTWSGWVKRGVLGTNGSLISGITSGSIYTELRFNSTDVLRFHQEDGATQVSGFNTTAVYRDPSAWYHVVCIYDSANATSANRLLIYVNGVLQSGSFDVSVPLNQASNINKASEATQIGNNTAGPLPFDGYMAEVNFVDGQALTPSSFGKTDAATNQWVPKKYAGTYGTNGFYLKFSDTSSTAALGTDFSGNSNTWTVNNISLTAGSTYDSMTDVPTLTNATTANYCTWNSLAKGSNLVTTSGNLSVNNGSVEANHRAIVGTMGMTTGKWYWEAVVNNSSSVDIIGVIPSSISTFNSYVSALGDSAGWGYNTSTGNYYVGGNWASSGTAPAFISSATIMIAYDADAKKMWFGQNGTWNTAAGGVGNPSSGTNATFTYSGSETTFLPAVSIYYNTGAWVVNFGQRPFAYTAPSGFKALNTFNLP